MKIRRPVSVAILTIAFGSVLAIPPGARASEATNPTYESVAWPTQSTKATAFIVRSSGGLFNAVPPVSLGCVNGQTKTSEIVLARLNGTSSASVGKMTCNLSGNFFDDARATIADVTLFDGMISIRGIDSHCFANQFTDTATVGSTWGNLITSGNYSKNGSGGIVLPNGAVVYGNTKYLSSTKTGTVAVTVRIPASPLNPAITLLIGGCELSRSPI